MTAHLQVDSVLCDVCGDASQNDSLGGVCVLEADGTPTMLCQACWESFSVKGLNTVPFHEIARKFGIGTDPSRPHELMDPAATFRINVMRSRARAFERGRASAWYFDRETHKFMTKSAARKSLPTEPDSSICHSCRQLFRQLRRCDGCHAVRYCSAECQKAHWKEHKAACKQVASTHQINLTLGFCRSRMSGEQKSKSSEETRKTKRRRRPKTVDDAQPPTAPCMFCGDVLQEGRDTIRVHCYDCGAVFCGKSECSAKLQIKGPCFCFSLETMG
jgi:hypothetical protein